MITAYFLSDNISEVVLHNDLHYDDSTYNMYFANNINTGNKVKAGAFVEVLSKGKISIIREYKKTVEGENTNTGYTKTVKQYTLHTYTWAVADDKAIPIKYTSNFLEEITADKKQQVQEYLKSKKLNPRNEKDFISTIKFYNSLN